MNNKNCAMTMDEKWFLTHLVADLMLIDEDDNLDEKQKERKKEHLKEQIFQYLAMKDMELTELETIRTANKRQAKSNDMADHRRIEFIRRLKTGKFNPRYDATHPAECKYCYKTHYDWALGTDFGLDIVWICQSCQHATKDCYMQIEGVKPSKEQQAFYAQYTPLIEQGQD